MHLLEAFSILMYIIAAFFGYTIGVLQNPRNKWPKRILSDSTEGALVSTIVRTMQENHGDWRQKNGTFMYFPKDPSEEIVFYILGDRRPMVKITKPVTTELSRENEKWVIESAETWQRELVLRQYELKKHGGQLI